MALASKWNRELNERVTAFLGSGGFEVVGTAARAHTAQDVQRIAPQDGHEMALELGREALETYPEAEGLFLAGGAWLSVHAVPVLEAEFGRPVVLNLQATVRAVLRELGAWRAVEGWGRLLASAWSPLKRRL